MHDSRWSFIKAGSLTVLAVLLFARALPAQSGVGDAGFTPAEEGLRSAVSTLTIYAIDVGQGDSALVVFPDRSTMLIDTGKSSEVSNVSDLLARLGITHLDKVVVTHTDGDHDGGYPKLQSSGVIDGSTTRYDWTNTTPGQVFYSGGDATVTCVTSNGYIIDGAYKDPGSTTNGTSVGVVVRFRGFDYLSCGDLESSAEQILGGQLAARGWKIDVLKVDHHGSKYSSPITFLQNVLPEFAVIMVGQNSFGHPTQETIDRLNDPTVRVQKILQTEAGAGGTASNVQVANGQIVIVTNGATYTFMNEGPGSTAFSFGPYKVDEPVYIDQPPHLLITEVALGTHRYPETHDWVELYLPPDAASLDLSQLYVTDFEQVSRAATGTVTLMPGDVAILHNADGFTENNGTGKGSNGWWDIFGQFSGSQTWNSYNDELAIATQNTLAPSQTGIIDAVVWANDDGSMYPEQAAAGNYLINLFQWGDPVAGSGLFTTVNEGPAIGPIKSGYAQRVTTADTDSVGDWIIKPSHSQGTPPPSSPPLPTPPPTPVPPKIVQVAASPSGASSGDPFNVSVSIRPILDRPFDAYAVILGPGVVYSIRFGNSLAPGVNPIARGVFFLPAGYVGTLLDMMIPPGVPGDYQAIVGLVDSGAKVTGVESAFAWDVAYFSVK